MVDRKALTGLRRRLERRYPGIDVTAILNVWDLASAQVLSFVGHRDDLERYGLVPFGFESGRMNHNGHLDEFGTRVAVWLEGPSGKAIAVHSHDVDTGARCGTRASQNPENAKTRAVVAKILKRFVNRSPA